MDKTLICMCYAYSDIANLYIILKPELHHAFRNSLCALVTHVQCCFVLEIIQEHLSKYCIIYYT